MKALGHVYADLCVTMRAGAFWLQTAAKPAAKRTYNRVTLAMCYWNSAAKSSRCRHLSTDPHG